jgi:hypothetical protein
MIKFDSIKDYCHWINWHEGDLILRNNCAYGKDGEKLATIEFKK